MKDDAPLLHDDLVTESLGKTTGKPLQRRQAPPVQAWATSDKGFAEAAVVVEREFHTATVHQGYIEPHNATALWNADGTRDDLVQHAGRVHRPRTRSAELLQMPVSQIKVVPMEIGGGFGGKIRVYLEPVAALLSREDAAGRSR